MNEDRASRYHRLRRRATVASTLAGAAWLVWLLASGFSRQLASWTLTPGAALPWIVGRSLAVALAAAATAVGWELVSLPFEFYRSFLLDRKYGLSSEPLVNWLGDYAKALALVLLLTMAGAVTVYGAVHVAGRAWWLLAAGLFGLGAVALSRIAPVLLMPLFFRFRPLDRERLRVRLLDLSRRAGVPVVGAFEWGLGEKTTRANAALVGVGRTRRILVSDTLLRNYSDDEIEVILAHEFAHHIHHDIWTGLALETLIVAAALFAAAVAVQRVGPRFGVSTVADPAGIPLLILAAGAVSLALTPLANAWSRRNERRADRFALALTGGREPFITAMRRLGVQNLAEERPSAPVFWFFHTHPTIDERITVAKTFEV